MTGSATASFAGFCLEASKYEGEDDADKRAALERLEEDGVSAGLQRAMSCRQSEFWIDKVVQDGGARHEVELSLIASLATQNTRSCRPINRYVSLVFVRDEGKYLLQ